MGQIALLRNQTYIPAYTQDINEIPMFLGSSYPLGVAAMLLDRTEETGSGKS